MHVTTEQLETSIADLQQWGLTIRDVNLLERRFEALYVWQLLAIDRQTLAQARGIGPRRLPAIVRAVESFLSGAAPLVSEADILRMELGEEEAEQAA